MLLLDGLQTWHYVARIIHARFATTMSRLKAECYITSLSLSLSDELCQCCFPTWFPSVLLANVNLARPRSDMLYVLTNQSPFPQWSNPQCIRCCPFQQTYACRIALLWCNQDYYYVVDGDRATNRSSCQPCLMTLINHWNIPYFAISILVTFCVLLV